MKTTGDCSSHQVVCLRPLLLPLPINAASNQQQYTIQILSRNGRVTSLLGLPRPHGLYAHLVEIGGGFPTDVLAADTSTPAHVIGAAGGTGIACFLSIILRPDAVDIEHRPSNAGPQHSHGGVWLWSIRGDDFRLVEYVLEKGLLDP